MKAKDIVKPNDIPEDECGVCYLHDKAYNKIGNDIPCPHCGVNVGVGIIMNNIETRIVGEQNGYEPEDKIDNMLYIDCPECQQPIGFKAIPIKYNANHDIYYTGGKYYVVGEKPKLNDKIKASIKQYTDRIKAGENLEPWNLETWIQYDVEALIAEFLYKNGLKE